MWGLECGVWVWDVDWDVGYMGHRVRCHGAGRGGGGREGREKGEERRGEEGGKAARERSVTLGAEGETPAPQSGQGGGGGACGRGRGWKGGLLFHFEHLIFSFIVLAIRAGL